MNAEAEAPLTLTSISWNVENLKRNVFTLKLFTDMYQPDLIFLSEPQTFQADIHMYMQYFQGDYSFALNSEDLHVPDLALNNTRTKGGTLVMWKHALDPYVTVAPLHTAAFLPVFLHIPGFQPSIHIALYLPTAGKDAEYFLELSALKAFIEDALDKAPNTAIFIRGDANSSRSNEIRDRIFSSFAQEYQLARVPINHHTYHHFMGNGQSDSELDVILFSDQPGINEALAAIQCGLLHPLVDSHHDLLVSTSSLPLKSGPTQQNLQNIVAPRVNNTRQKIVWTKEDISKYQVIVANLLKDLRSRWLDPSKQSCISILIQATNFIMNFAASSTNRTISLSRMSPVKPVKIPKIIKKSSNILARASSLLKHITSQHGSTADMIAKASMRVKKARKEHRQLIRIEALKINTLRDSKLRTVKPDTELYKGVRKIKNSSNVNVLKLKVGEKTYIDSNVSDGFYDSISSLKKLDTSDLSQSSSYISSLEDLKNIMKICSTGTPVPQISLQKTKQIVKRIRPSVADYFSITGYHYLHGGDVALEHLHFLLNGILHDLNNMQVDELNIAWACILYKGHSKERSSERSYRTISTCPFISKVLDSYIADLYSSFWNNKTASTQFQRPSSSHELAALALTETVHFSVNTLSKPAFVLYLDAKSAFDRVLHQLLIQKLYDVGIQDQGLILINSRLSSRKTILEWNKTLMGPIADECGVEQGGVNSSEFYKVYNNEQLQVAQNSRFGVPIGPVTISSIGQADDVALISNNIHSLQALLDLTLSYCKKYHVTLCHDKTKLQVFSSRATEVEAFHSKIISPIEMNNKVLKFVSEVEHVGTVRSTTGNLPHILARITAHRRAMFAILPLGLSQRHRSNPAGSINAYQTYSTPVLLSCVAALGLKNSITGGVNKGGS